MELQRPIRIARLQCTYVEVHSHLFSSACLDDGAVVFHQRRPGLLDNAGPICIPRYALSNKALLDEVFSTIIDQSEPSPAISGIFS